MLCLGFGALLWAHQRDESAVRDANRQGLAGDYRGALARASGVTAAPALSGALLTRARAEVALGRLRDASAEFAAAAARSPRDWSIRAEWGAALLALGDRPAARAQLALARRLNPLS